MKRKDLICIVCPNGCPLQAEMEDGSEIQINDMGGRLCKKGAAWARQELLNPVRTISSSIIVDDGDFPLVSVRTDCPIPLEGIFTVMEEIKSARVKAPVRIGDILIKNPARTACNIIATRNVNSAGAK